MTDDHGDLTSTYRNLLWGIVISLIFAFFGYGFFLHSLISDLQKVQAQREYWWTWAGTENTERKKQIDILRDKIDSLEREQDWRQRERK